MKKNRDLILLGAYKNGSDAALDYAITKYPEIESFLQQNSRESSTLEETVEKLVSLFKDT